MMTSDLHPALAAMEQTPVRPGGPTVAQLRAVFDSIRDPSDWREPIDIEVWTEDIHAEDLALVPEAVEFFTATTPTITDLGDRVRIQADGYRNGPAGP